MRQGGGESLKDERDEVIKMEESNNKNKKIN